MGYLISFIVGGLFGLMLMPLLASARDEEYRKELITRLRKEIYEEIHSSSDYDSEE